MMKFMLGGLVFIQHPILSNGFFSFYSLPIDSSTMKCMHRKVTVSNFLEGYSFMYLFILFLFLQVE